MEISDASSHLLLKEPLINTEKFAFDYHIGLETKLGQADFTKYGKRECNFLGKLMTKTKKIIINASTDPRHTQHCSLEEWHDPHSHLEKINYLLELYDRVDDDYVKVDN